MLLKDDTVYVYNGMILHHDCYNIGKRYFAITEDRPQYEYGVVVEAETPDGAASSIEQFRTLGDNDI